MKSLTFWEAAFIVLIYLKLQTIGAVPTWFQVFLPLIIGALLPVLQSYLKIAGWENRLAFWIWKTALKIRMIGRKRKAKQMIQEATKRGASNPGKFIDPSNLGK
jgi:hypothetical protein